LIEAEVWKHDEGDQACHHPGRWIRTDVVPA
jgi:hypothetical protein